jgi:hypothetical protein
MTLLRFLPLVFIVAGLLTMGTAALFPASLRKARIRLAASALVATGFASYTVAPLSSGEPSWHRLVLLGIGVWLMIAGFLKFRNDPKAERSSGRIT